MDVSTPRHHARTSHRQSVTRILVAALLAVATARAAEPDGPPSYVAEAEPPNDSQPYVVFVAQAETYARCGPGESHYPTESLRPGQELEVYVETDDGWLGIRPPEESFCWMPADAVAIAANRRTGTIREDKTVAWIGTNLGQARRYRWQVQLHAGERVAIIDETDRETEDGPKRWLRIVPPAGEFRWVHRDQVVESAEQLADKLVRSALEPQDAGEMTRPTLAQVQPSETARPASFESEAPQDPAAPPQRNGLQNAEGIPKLRPAPSSLSRTRSSRRRLRDGPLQFHRADEMDQFPDRGAVIGSGLKSDWDDTQPQGSPPQAERASGRSVLETDLADDSPASGLPQPSAVNGAAAAASAIAEPLRRVTDVVANFISPPRLVEIGPQTPAAPVSPSPADRRWSVGAPRSTNGDEPAEPTEPSAGAGAASSSTSGTPDAPNATPSRLGLPVVQAGGAAAASPRPPRIVSIDQIANVEDAVAGADLAKVGAVLSRLIADRASADEVDPLIRRVQSLLAAGDVNQATRARNLLQRAQRYRNLAARRDGVTRIQSALDATAGQVDDASNLALASASEPTTTSSTTSKQQASSASLSPSNPPASGGASRAGGETATVESSLPGTASGNATGYLVQVYSARPNSPPYALTDDAGLTVAYVTPYPGVSLRHHLNSRIEVSGQEKLLEGLATPHILVDQAVRR